MSFMEAGDGLNKEKELLAKQSAKGAILNICSMLFVRFGGLLFYIILFRFIPAAEAGIYFLYIAVSSLISIFCTFGMSESLARFIPFYEGKKEAHKIKPLVFTVSLTLIISSALIFLIGAGTKEFLINYNKELAGVIYLTILTGVVSSFNSFLASIFLGMKKFSEVAFFSSTQSAFKIILFIAFIFFTVPNLEHAIYATILALFINNIIMGWILFPSIHKFSGEYKLLSLKEYYAVVSYGIVAAFNTVSTYIIGWTDTLVLGYYVTSTLLGAYNIVTNVARTLMHFISANVFFILTSLLSHLHGAKSEIFGPLASNASRWSVYLTLPIAILSLFFPEEIIQVLFPAYVEYYWLLYVFIPVFFISVLSLPAKSALSAIARNDLIFKSTAIAILPNIILNLALIPEYKILGAVFATFLSYSIGEIVAIFYALKVAKYSFHPLLTKTILPALGMTIALFFSYPYFNYSSHGIFFEMLGVGLVSLCALLIYFIILVKTNSLNKTDHMLIEKFIKKASEVKI